MIKEIKGDNKISESREVINENFKELDKRIKVIEEKLNIKSTNNIK